MPALHEELTGSVMEIKPYGYLVRLPDGQTGFMDQTKAPVWFGEGPPLAVGDTITVAVVDDERTPYRVSALDRDLVIARELRS